MTKRLVISLAGDATKASSRVRGFWIAEKLEARGHSVELFRVEDKLGYVRLAFRIARSDAIIFQKTYSRYDPWLAKFANILGKDTFFDIDDNPSRTNDLRTNRNAHSMMSVCRGVFAGCNALKQKAEAVNVATLLVPSGVKLENYAVKSGEVQPDFPCLGWIGNGAHYADDLVEILMGPLVELSKTRKFRLKIVGACGDERIWSSFAPLENIDVEIVDEIDWKDPSAVAAELQSFDIGLYPLGDNEFNRYKCGFKAIEYMATGLPVVASDAANHRDIVAEGVSGFIAVSKEDWVSALKRLCDDPGLRRRMGQEGRQIVEQQFSVDAIATKIEQVILQY